MAKFKAFTIASNGGKLSALKTPVNVGTDNGQIDVVAVWDTGASGTCISKRVAKFLKLTPIGMSSYNTAAGEVDCNDYIVDIVLPNSVCCRNCRVSEFAGGENLDMLIGMDIICQGDMAITNADGNTMMSYRIPAGEKHINYVEMDS